VFILYWLGDAAGLLSDHDPQRYDPACIAPNLLLIQGWGACHYLSFNFVSWSISAEFGMYLALPVFLWIGRRGVVWLAALTGLALAGLLAISLPAGPPRDFHQWTFDFGVLRALPAFLLGMIAWRLKPLLASIPAPRAILWGLFALFLVGSALKLDRTVLLCVVYALALAGVAADAAGPVGPLSRRLAPLGQLTYSLYMLHPIILKAMLAHAGLGHLHLSADAMRFWAIGWALALLPISYLSLMFFERPARDWINRLGSSNRVKPHRQIADRA
jgi:peptidoglycan/LPS O-acetylase OafA/YrhL